MEASSVKRFIIRSFAASLALCSVLLMASCEKTPNNPSDTTTNISASVSDSTSGNETPGTPAAKLNVVVDGKAQLGIIRSEKASDAIVQSCISLNKRLTKLLEATFTINDDWIKRDTTPDPDARRP